MTCHHRNPFDTPRYRVGEAKRCRCQVIRDGVDHCHQQADGEDMLCKHCRKICWVEAPTNFIINMTDANIACAVHHCPPVVF